MKFSAIVFSLAAICVGFAGTPASADTPTSFSSLARYYFHRCGDRPNVGTDTQWAAEVSSLIKGAPATIGASRKVTESILEASDGDVQKMAQIRYAACQAYRTSSIDENTFAIFTDAWLRAMRRMFDDNGPTVVLIDSVVNSYRKDLRDAGASNADDIIDGLLMSPRFMRKHKLILNGENASTLWNRTDQILLSSPSVAIIHFSAFEPQTFDLEKCSTERSNLNTCNYKFFSLTRELLGEGIPIIVYTRTPGVCQSGGHGRKFRQRFSNLLGSPEDPVARKVFFLAMRGRSFADESAIDELQHVIEAAFTSASITSVTDIMPPGSTTRCLLAKP